MSQKTCNLQDLPFQLASWKPRKALHRTASVAFGCENNEAFNGDISKNRNNSDYFSANEIMIYLDGQQHGIKPLYQGAGHTCVHNQFSRIVKANRDEESDIDRSDFVDGYALYLHAFNLKPDLLANQYFNLASHGSVRL